MDGIDTSVYAISAQRAQLNFRAHTADAPANDDSRRTHCGDGDKSAVSCVSNDQDVEQSLRYQRTENSVLKIRTQEGDIVALRIRVGESVKISSDSDLESGTEIAETTLKAKSSTKLSLTVKGDLNDAEMAAIQAVFVQSAALADEFFAGDYAAAFESASALQIDAQQLAKVSLRLKVRESLTYSGSGLPPILFGAPSHSEPEATSAITDSKPAPAPARPEPETAVPVAAEENSESATDAVATESESAGETLPAEQAASPAATSASAFWFAAVIDFVGKLIDTFDVPAETVEPSESESHGKLELDLSLKLRIFSSMLVEISNSAVSSDEPSGESLPALVPATIDAVANEQEPAFEAVA